MDFRRWCNRLRGSVNLQWFFLRQWFNGHVPTLCGLCGRLVGHKDTRLAQTLAGGRVVKLCPDCYRKSFPGGR